MVRHVIFVEIKGDARRRKGRRQGRHQGRAGGLAGKIPGLLDVRVYTDAPAQLCQR